MELKQKPSGIYYIDIEIDDEEGQPKRARISFNTRDERQAKSQLRMWSMGVHPKQVAARKPKKEALVSAPKASGWTVRAALERGLRSRDVWGNAKAQASIKSNVKILCQLVGDERLIDMKYNRIEALMEQMRSELGYAEGTIKRKLDCLSKVVDMSTVWEDPATGRPYLEGKPKWPKVSAGKNRKRELADHEEEAVLSAIDKRIAAEPNKHWWRFKCYVLILLDSGCRAGEALVLDDDHIDTILGVDDDTGDDVEMTFLHFYAHETKTSTERTVPATPRVVTLIKQLSEIAGGGAYFPWAKGSSTPWAMWDAIRSDVKKAGRNIDDVVLHTLRHTCANRLRRAGHPLEEVQRWLGHSSIAVTADVYTHVDSMDLFRSMRSRSNGAKRTLRAKDSPEPTVQIPHVSGNNRADPGTVLN